MMKTQLQLAAFIVHFGLVFVYPYNKNGYQFWDPSTLSAKNNLEEKKNFIKTLQNGVSASQHVFDTMKSELQKAQNMNTQKRNFNRRSNIFEKNMMRKREIDNLQRYNYNITYVTSSSGNGCTSGADTDKLKDKQPYIFPETKTDNAIDTATNLLNSQGTYQKEVERCFRAICKKNQNHTKIELLERSIDGTIEMAGELVHNSTEIIQETIKNGSVSDYFKKKPITFKTSRLLVDCWNYVDDFAKNYVKQNDFDANPEADVMLKCADLAIREIKAYQKYLEIVYEETGIYRDDETNFSYLKFKKKEEEWKNRDRSD